jgi:hypothetical protein
MNALRRNDMAADVVLSNDDIFLGGGCNEKSGYKSVLGESIL